MLALAILPFRKAFHLPFPIQTPALSLKSFPRTLVRLDGTETRHTELCEPLQRIYNLFQWMVGIQW